VDPFQIIGRLIFQVSLLPVDLSGPISIQGTGLSKIDCADQMLDMHEDPSFEEKNGEGLKLYADMYCYGTDALTYTEKHYLTSLPVHTIKVLEKTDGIA
jgi:hypothetical protein